MHSISWTILMLLMVALRSSEGLKVNVTSSEFNDIEETYPTNCHVCRFLVEEIYIYMMRSRTHDVVQIGSEFQNTLRKIKFNKSELRLVEAIEEACQKMLEYKVHKDKPIRYQRGKSTTFKTLEGLRERGVKVDLGFPYEMWDSPDREIQDMKKKCEKLVEDHENDISSWYFDNQEKNLTHWLCRDRVLRKDEQDCLDIETGDMFPDVKSAEEASKKEEAAKEKEERKKRREAKVRNLEPSKLPIGEDEKGRADAVSELDTTRRSEHLEL